MWQLSLRTRLLQLQELGLGGRGRQTHKVNSRVHAASESEQVAATAATAATATAAAGAKAVALGYSRRGRAALSRRRPVHRRGVQGRADARAVAGEHALDDELERFEQARERAREA